MVLLGLHLVTSFRMEDTGSLRDVHLLVRTAYNHWKNEGAWRTVMESVVDVLKCGVLALSIFVLGFMVNWDSVLTCSTELECQQRPVMHNPSFQTVPGAHTILVLILFASAVIACLYECKRCVETAYVQYELHDMLSNSIDCGSRSPFHTLRDIWFRYRASADGHEELPLGDNLPALSDLPWNEYLDIFCRVIRADRSLAIVRQSRFDELRAIQALMVYDNYFIALHQKLLHPEVAHGFTGPAITLVDQSILRFLLQALFDSSNCLNLGLDQHRVIRDSLFKYLVAYWAFYPFLVSHALVKMVVKNVAAFRARPSEFLDRQWTQKAWWSCRLFNEVPHVTNERLVAAQVLANEMLSRIDRPSALAKFMERVAATIIVAILFLSFLNPAVLMGGVVSDRSLVWWLSTWFLVFTAFHAPDQPMREYHHKTDLQSLCHLLHYEAPGWSVSGSRWASSVQWDYFHSRWYVLGSALVRTLLMPLILLKVYFDESIPLLVDVIQSNSLRVDGVGSIAADAHFSHNPNLDPDKKPLRNNDAISDDGPPMVSPRDSDVTYKHEKSIGSFASVYPRWRCRAMSHEVSAAAELGLQSYLGALFGDENDDDSPHSDNKVDGTVDDDDERNEKQIRGAVRLRESDSSGRGDSSARFRSGRGRTMRPQDPRLTTSGGSRQASLQSQVHETQHRIVSRIDIMSSTMLRAAEQQSHTSHMLQSGTSGSYGAAALKGEASDVEMQRAVNMPADSVSRSDMDDDDDDAEQAHEEEPCDPNAARGHARGGRGRRHHGKHHR